MKSLSQSVRASLFASVASVASCLFAVNQADAQTTLIAPGILQYGDADLSGYGYPTGENPMQGATIIGLAAGADTLATNAYGHSFPFAPDPSDYAGTDQIYVGSNQTGSDDGYSQYDGRKAGPQVVTFNYGSLVSAGTTITGLTFGIAADDFQFQAFGNPFTATINGVTNTTITNQLNALNQTGPYEQFFSVGLNTASLLPSNVLTLTINEGGNGGDGWDVDFFTIGVTTKTTSAVAPEPNSFSFAVLGSVACGGTVMRLRRQRQRSKV